MRPFGYPVRPSTIHFISSSRIAFEGIGQSFEHLSGSEAERIRLANRNGIGKTIKIILVLQQSIKTLMRDTRGAEFVFEEYHAMFRLMCGMEQGIPNAGPGQAADRSYGMHVIELEQLEQTSMDGLMVRPLPSQSPHAFTKHLVTWVSDVRCQNLASTTVWSKSSITIYGQSLPQCSQPRELNTTKFYRRFVIYIQCQNK